MAVPLPAAPASEPAEDSVPLPPTATSPDEADDAVIDETGTEVGETKNLELPETVEEVVEVSEIERELRAFFQELIDAGVEPSAFMDDPRWEDISERAIAEGLETWPILLQMTAME